MRHAGGALRSFARAAGRRWVHAREPGLALDGRVARPSGTAASSSIATIADAPTRVAPSWGLAARRHHRTVAGDAAERRRSRDDAAPTTRVTRRGMAKETPRASGVPKGHTLSAEFNNARSQGLRAFLLSPGVIADPYRGPRPWPALSSFLGTSGWKALVRMISRPVHDVLTLGQCQQIKGFTRDNFKAEAGQLYRQISQLIAENHVTSLRHLVTEKALTDIKREAKTREKAGWGKIVWEIRDLEKPVTLQGRMIFPNPQDKQMAFAQMTVGFRSHQRYAAYDGKGRLVAGDPSGFLPVEDVWVLEHAFKLPNARWRLAARLPALAPGEKAPRDADDAPLVSGWM